MLDVLDALYLSAMIHLNAFIRDEKGDSIDQNAESVVS